MTKNLRFRLVGAALIIALLAYLGLRQSNNDVFELSGVVSGVQGEAFDQVAPDPKSTRENQHLAQANGSSSSNRFVPENPEGVALLIKELDAASSHEWNAAIPKGQIDQLHRLSKGDPVQIRVGHVDLEGTLDVIVLNGVFQKFLVRLSENAGELIVNYTHRRKLRAHLFFYNRSDAFEIVGGEKDEFFTLSSLSVSDLLCAPKGSTYPVHIGSPQSTIDWTPPPSPSPEDGSVPILNSKPDSEFVLYCDFDGEVVTDPRWNSGITINAVPLPLATDASWVTAVFRRVAEDFMPFDINVTTDVNVFDSADPVKRIQTVITSTKDAAPTAGGVAYLNSFGEGTVCWSFNESEYSCADTISHEVGHTVGLGHDGLNTDSGAPLEEYYGGHGDGETSWGPIMGAAFSFSGQITGFENPNVTQWSSGDYTNASRQQDDLQVFVTGNNGLGFRDDDHPNNFITAALISIDETAVSPLGAVVEQNGIIERNTDEDWFFFPSEGGQLRLTASVLDVFSNRGVESGSDTFGSNLAVSLSLFDSDLVLINESSPANSLGANLDVTLSPGVYYVVVAGAARETPDTAFSDYGSLGEYKLTGTLPLGPLAVFGNAPEFNQLIGNEDSTPSTIDGTFVGFISLAEEGLKKTYQIRNTGSDPVTVGSIISSSPFFIVEPFSPRVIPPLSNVDFTVTFMPQALGRVEGTISFGYFTDEAKDYQFAVAGIGSLTDGDDSYEQNDSFFETFDLSAYDGVALNNIFGEALQADRDWYKITVPSGFNTISATATFTNALGNLDLALYDEGGFLLVSAEGTEDVEVLDYLEGDLSGGIYYLTVYASGESGQKIITNTLYDLIWSYDLTPVVPPTPEDNYEENDTIYEAYDLSTANGVGLSAVDGLGNQLDNDWFFFTTEPGDNVVSVTLNYDESSGNLDLALYSDSYRKLSDSLGTNGEESITLPVDSSGETFYVVVHSADSIATGNSYELLWESSFQANTDDAYEENDTQDGASTALVGSGVALSNLLGVGVQSDDDWYVIRPDPSVPLVIVRATFTHDDGNIDLEVFDSGGSIIGTGVSSSDDEFVSMEVHGESLFYVRVFGDDIGNSYDLLYEELTEDAYEENDSIADAYDLTGFNGVLISEIEGSGVSNDDDFFFYDVPAGSGSLDIEMFLIDDEGDLDMELFDSDGLSIAVSQGVNDFEQIVILPDDQGRTLNAGVYTLRVYGLGGPTQSAYNLRFTVEESAALPPPSLDDSYEDNNNWQSAYDISGLNENFLSSIDGNGVQIDADWYEIFVPAGQNRLTVQAIFTHYAGGNIDIALYASSGIRISESVSGDDNETINQLLSPSGGTYYVLVYGAGVGIEYDLWLSTDAPPADDAYEANNTLPHAYNLSSQENVWLEFISGEGRQYDNDWYSFSLPGGSDLVSVDIEYSHSASENLSLKLYRNGFLVDSSDSSDGTEQVVYSGNNDLTAEYSVAVSGSGVGTAYNLMWFSSPSINTLEDAYEENDTFFEAYDLSSQQLVPLSAQLGLGVSLDQDWFKIDVPSDNLSVVIDPSLVEVPYTVYLYDSDGRLRDSFGPGDQFFYGVDAGGDTVYLRVDGGFRGATYDLSWDVVPIGTNGPGGILASEANPDGDRFPDWAEYTLDLDPDVFSSDVIRQFRADGYSHVQFRQRQEAIDAEFKVIVKESPNLAFSDSEAVHVSTVTSPDDPDVVIVTYRCSQPLSIMRKCFFMLEIQKPD